MYGDMRADEYRCCKKAKAIIIFSPLDLDSVHYRLDFHTYFHLSREINPMLHCLGLLLLLLPLRLCVTDFYLPVCLWPSAYILPERPQQQRTLFTETYSVSTQCPGLSNLNNYTRCLYACPRAVTSEVPFRGILNFKQNYLGYLTDKSNRNALESPPSQNQVH